MLGNKWLQSLSVPPRTNPAWGKDKRWTYLVCILESHDSTSGKRAIWNRTGNLPTRRVNGKRPGTFSDVKNDLTTWSRAWWTEGESWVLAVALTIWLFSQVHLYLWGPILCHENSLSPLGHIQTSVSWIFLGTVSQNIFDNLWFISVAIYGYRTWMRKKIFKQQQNKTWGLS